MPNNPKAMGRVQSEFEVKFTDETYQALKAFEDEIERRYDAKTFATVLQSALTSGAKSIVPDVRAQVPSQKYGTRRLRGAIRARASRFMTPASVVGIGLGALIARVRGTPGSTLRELDRTALRLVVTASFTSAPKW